MGNGKWTQREVRFLYFTELIKYEHQQTVISYVCIIPKGTTKQAMGRATL